MTETVAEIVAAHQAGADDAAVAGDDLLAAVLGLEVRDQQELGGELLVDVVRAQHEALLVRPDGGADHLGRHLEELLLEGPHQRHRPLDQPGDLGQNARILDDLKPAREGEVRGFLRDMGRAFIGVQHHLRPA